MYNFMGETDKKYLKFPIRSRLNQTQSDQIKILIISSTELELLFMFNIFFPMLK